MRTGRDLDRLAVRADLPVRLVHVGERGLGLLEQAGVLQRDRGVRGERREQADLGGRERADGAVHGEQRADDGAVDDERDAEDGADLLAGDRGVDVVAVQEALVGLVVVGVVRRPGLRDQPEEAGAEGQPELAELRGERAVGDAHVGGALRLVVERQVGHVGVQQLPGPADDRAEDRVDVADGGEVAGGLVEGGQLRLALALPDELLAQPERDPALRAELLDLGLRQPVPLGAGHHLVERLPRRLGVEQVEERGRSDHGLKITRRRPRTVGRPGPAARATEYRGADGHPQLAGHSGTHPGRPAPLLVGRRAGAPARGPAGPGHADPAGLRPARLARRDALQRAPGGRPAHRAGADRGRRGDRARRVGHAEVPPGARQRLPRERRGRGRPAHRDGAALGGRPSCAPSASSGNWSARPSAVSARPRRPCCRRTARAG